MLAQHSRSAKERHIVHSTRRMWCQWEEKSDKREANHLDTNLIPLLRFRTHLRGELINRLRVLLLAGYRGARRAGTDQGSESRVVAMKSSPCRSCAFRLIDPTEAASLSFIVCSEWPLPYSELAKTRTPKGWLDVGGTGRKRVVIYFNCVFLLLLKWFASNVCTYVYACGWGGCRVVQAGTTSVWALWPDSMFPLFRPLHYPYHWQAHIHWAREQCYNCNFSTRS